MVARRASKRALRRFYHLQPGFLGCAKLKQAARGDVTYWTSVGRTYRPEVPDCACVLQPIVKFCAIRTPLRSGPRSFYFSQAFPEL